jgi:hypothetical protein
LTPVTWAAVLRQALLASILRGAFVPMDLRAVCFVRGIGEFFLLAKELVWTLKGEK